MQGLSLTGMSNSRWSRQACAWAFFIYGCWTIGSAQAQELALEDPEPPVSAKAWLMRAQKAASVKNYQGILVISGGGSVTSSRVVHFSRGTQQFEHVEALDGEPRSIWRHNELVQTVWPQAKVALVEQRDPRASFPALLSAGGKRVLEWYELRLLGHDRVAGYEADVVLLKARDSLRFSQRLWAERGSGLLLRSEVLGSNGRPLESVAFSELTIGIKAQPDQVLDGLRDLKGYRVLHRVSVPATLEGEGWSLGALPAGFHEVNCAKRSLDPLSAKGSPTVLQAIFTDGLTHVSVFIEPYDPARHIIDTSAAVGATHTLVSHKDNTQITVMGDVPPATLERFMNALTRRH
jgi:sigma-E factor negative regulatory protein RseB